MRPILLAVLTYFAAMLSLQAEPQDLMESKQNEPDLLADFFEELHETSDQVLVPLLENEIRAVWRYSESESVSILMNRGLGALATDDLERAETHFSDVAKLVPRHVDVWFRLATVSERSNNPRQAIRFLQTVVALEPRHFDAWLMLARIMLDLNDEKSAYHAYKQALEANPHLKEAERAVQRLKREVEGQGI